MTEDEAFLTWCPHAVASHTDPRALINRVPGEVEVTWDGGQPSVRTFLHNCIGSRCSQWRVRFMSQEERVRMHGEQRRLGLTIDKANVFVNAADLGDGYCGLAGPIGGNIR